jgi:hypothetical protein
MTAWTCGRAGRRSHTAGSGGLRQASRSFISCSSSRSHLRTASIRSTSVGTAGRLFDCHAISATSLRLSTGSPCFKLTAVQRARICLTVPCPLRPPWASLAGKLLNALGDGFLQPSGKWRVSMVGHFRLSMLRLHWPVRHVSTRRRGGWSHAHLASRLKSGELTLPVLKVIGSPQWRGFIRVPQLLFGRVQNSSSLPWGLPACSQS